MGVGARLSSSQSGKIAEYFVATSVMAHSAGRLSPFVPLSDDHGVDLVILDKQSGRKLSVQVKSWLGGEAGSTRATAQFDLRKATFGCFDDSVLVAVILDPVKMGMDAAWAIPMRELDGVATEQADKFVIAPSRAAASRDKYVRYRHFEPATLVEALGAMTAGAVEGVTP